MALTSCCGTVSPNGSCLDGLEQFDGGDLTNPDGHHFVLYLLPQQPTTMTVSGTQQMVDACVAAGLRLVAANPSYYTWCQSSPNYNCMSSDSTTRSTTSNLHDITGWEYYVALSLGQHSGWNIGSGLVCVTTTACGDAAQRL